jgi:hypothetical protein
MLRSRPFWFLYRLCAAGAAWTVGFGVYVWAALWDGCFDGFPALILQPLMGLLVSLSVVGVSLAAGALFLLSDRLVAFWRRLAPGLAPALVALLIAELVLPVVATTHVPLPSEAGIRELTTTGYILLMAYPVLLFGISCFPAFAVRARVTHA